MENSQTHSGTIPLHKQATLRSPNHVMQLERMGCFFPTRLSFMRTLMRRLSSERAAVRRPVWRIDENGFGVAVYSIDLSGYTYSLIAYSNELKDEDRTDRVIAEAWDSTYVLFDGAPTDADIDRLKSEVPRQEAGRYSSKELILSRANKSVRLFQYVADCLASGNQPDIAKIAAVGYLMRTTAVYGNGKFGIADRDVIAGRPGLSGPFQAEMLTVWLIRGFTHDLADYVGVCKGGVKAVSLSDDIKKYLGIGNSTGLGMAPFLVNHPTLLSNWMSVRETAIARVKALETLSKTEITKLLGLFNRAKTHCSQWSVDDTRQMDRIHILRTEFEVVSKRVSHEYLSKPYPIEALIDEAEKYSIEMQELICSMVIEPFSDLVDGLEECMLCTHTPKLDTKMQTSQLQKLIEEHYDWALKTDFEKTTETALFWYVSEEKLEPRIGQRYEEPGAELEQPLDIARQVQALHHTLNTQITPLSLARFLMQYPQHRQIALRIQSVTIYPYQEIHHNLIADTTLPIDMLRCKLSFFGASKFDPKSDRWTRITLYQGAPLSSDIAQGTDDDWWLPVMPEKSNIDQLDIGQ